MATIEDVRGIKDTFGRPNMGIVHIVYDCPKELIESAMNHLGYKWSFNDMNKEQICGSVYYCEKEKGLVIIAEHRRIHKGLVPLILKKEPIDDNKLDETKLEVLDLYKRLHAYVGQEQGPQPDICKQILEQLFYLYELAQNSPDLN
jgi:hypothetical protein